MGALNWLRGYLPYGHMPRGGGRLDEILPGCWFGRRSCDQCLSFTATPGEGVADRTDDEFNFRMIAHPRGGVLLGRVAHGPSALFTPFALIPTHWNCTLMGRRPAPFVQDVISVPSNLGGLVATGADIFFRINQLPMSLAPACST